MLKYLFIFLIAVALGFLMAYLFGAFSSNEKIDSNLEVSEDGKKIGKLDVDESVKELKGLGYTYDESTIKKILISLSSMLTLSKEDLKEIDSHLSKGKSSGSESKSQKSKSEKSKSDDEKSKTKDDSSKNKKESDNVIFGYNKSFIKYVFGREDGVKYVLSGSDSKAYEFKRVFDSLKTVDPKVEKNLKEILPDYSKYVKKADGVVSKHKIGEIKISENNTSEKKSSSVKLSEHVFYCLLREYVKVVEGKPKDSK